MASPAKNKVRAGHKEPNNRATVKRSEAECNCCGTDLYCPTVLCHSGSKKSSVVKSSVSGVSGMEYGH